MDGLRAALHDHGSAAVLLGSRLQGPLWRARIDGALTALAPQLRLETSTEGNLSDVLQAPGQLPVDRRPVSEDGGRGPSYRWTDLQLQGPAVQARTGPVGAETLVALDDAEVDLQKWRALPAHFVGSCEPALQALAAGQEQSLAMLEPFLDHADALLWKVYRAEIEAFLPALAEELASFARDKARVQFEDARTWDRYRCGHAYWDYVQKFQGCRADVQDCPSAPRVFLLDGAKIGSVEPSFLLPDRSCAALVGRDYVAELRGLARDAAQVVGEHLDPRLVVLADRLGTITEVDAALEAICTPRRRRFRPTDLAQARARLVRIGEALRSTAPPSAAGRWTVVEEASFHVPGVGPVRELSRYDAGPQSPSARVVQQSRALREFVLERARCRAELGQLPLAVMVAGAEPAAIEFFGYFYEEELFCPDLPPVSTAQAAEESGPPARGR